MKKFDFWYGANGLEYVSFIGEQYIYAMNHDYIVGLYVANEPIFDESQFNELLFNGEYHSLNGWEVWINDNSNFKFTGAVVAFHPLYDGHYYEELNTMEQAQDFCTEERFNEWTRNLL